jgi:hypothetical protein
MRLELIKDKKQHNDDKLFIARTLQLAKHLSMQPQIQLQTVGNTSDLNSSSNLSISVPTQTAPVAAPPKSVQHHSVRHQLQQWTKEREQTRQYLADQAQFLLSNAGHAAAHHNTTNVALSSFYSVDGSLVL